VRSHADESLPKCLDIVVLPFFPMSGASSGAAEFERNRINSVDIK
jgi:hypothetical protein